MPNYGSVDYWNRRYCPDDDPSLNSPFDWLFEFNDLEGVLAQLIRDKDAPLLMVGAGNAPFSPDMYFKGGYTSILNIDISDVVIAQQRAAFPEQQWIVMDVLNMDFESGSIPLVLDKSLIDTLLCYKNSAESTKAMIAEIYRVMAPGARYITFSLHTREETVAHFAGHDWHLSAFYVKSNRWNETDNRKRAVAHVMVVCDKPLTDGAFLHHHPLSLDGVLSDDELRRLEEHQAAVNERAAFSDAGIDALLDCLDRSLKQYSVVGKIARPGDLLDRTQEEFKEEARSAALCLEID